MRGASNSSLAEMDATKKKQFEEQFTRDICGTIYGGHLRKGGKDSSRKGGTPLSWEEHLDRFNMSTTIGVEEKTSIAH